MFFASTIEVVLVYERMRGHARFYLAYSLVTLGLNLGLNILFIGGLGAGVWGFVSSKLITSVGGAGFLAWRLRRDVGWHWHGAYVPEFVRFGAPLIVSGLSYFAIHFSDRFFLTSAVSLAELGRYALAYRFALMVNGLVGDSFAKSWTVSLYRHTGDPGWREQFARVAAYFTFAVALAGFAIAVFGPELLRVMVPESFFPPALLLPILVLAYVVRDVADFFRSLLLINKRSVWVGKIALAAAVLNLLANMLLIPAYGTYGAAWATLLTWSAYLVVCWIAADREHRLPVRVAAYARLLGLAVAAYAAAATIRADGFIAASGARRRLGRAVRRRCRRPVPVRIRPAGHPAPDGQRHGGHAGAGSAGCRGRRPPCLDARLLLLAAERGRRSPALPVRPLPAPAGHAGFGRLLPAPQARLQVRGTPLRPRAARRRAGQGPAERRASCHSRARRVPGARPA